MSKVPDKMEMVQFICSGCGKRSMSGVKDEKMKCTHCGEVYRRVKGEWVWRMADNPRKK